MTRRTSKRGVRKAPDAICRPTSAELVRLAGDIAQSLESDFHGVEKGLTVEAMQNDGAPLTPGQRADLKGRFVVPRMLASLLRRNPSVLGELDLRIAISVEDLRALEQMPADLRRANMVVRLGREIDRRLSRNDPRLLRALEEDLE